MREDWERRGKPGICPVPDEPISQNEMRRVSVPIYGISRWGDLFTARQKVALNKLGTSIQRVSPSPGSEVRAASAMCLGRVADYNSSTCTWVPHGEFVGHTFTRQAVPIVWDFAEVNPVAGSSGSFEGATKWVVNVIEAWPGSELGQVQLADATNHPLPDQSASLWFTDPPYYDAVPYAHLADFFFVWLKRLMLGHPLFSRPRDARNGTTPKDREVVVDRPHRLSDSKKDVAFYEQGMATAFAEGRRVLQDDGIGSVVFAHKTTEGWEALLSGMIRGGWTLTGSWPITTERGARLNARDTASLATSVHLICRPRSEGAPIGDWAEVLKELPVRVNDWMERLQGEGVRGADLVFACIGPALEIYSRYSQVETAAGQKVGLAEYLEKVWEVVGRTALENVLGSAEARARNGIAGALEEDARLTALFLWTLQATNGDENRDSIGDEEVPDDGGGEEDEDGEGGNAKGFSLVFDVVRRFAQPLGIDLPKWEKRTIETKKGVVRLLPVAERARQLFGERGSQAVAAWLEQEAAPGTDPLQGVLFPDPQERGAFRVRERRPRYGDGDDVSDRSATAPGTTTLDRVHAGMLLQAGGRTSALRALVQAEQERGPDFLRLSNALSALYPRGSEEKRLLDAMLLAVPR